MGIMGIKITGPGEYKNRSGRKCIVLCMNPVIDSCDTYRWIGVDDDGEVMSWSGDGNYYRDGESSYDIVCEWKEPRKFVAEIAVCETDTGRVYTISRFPDDTSVIHGKVLARKKVTLVEGEM